VTARRRSPAGRRQSRVSAAAADSRLELIKRAREALPTLPTDSLYRIHDLLERALAETELDPKTLDELDRALKPPAS
jgi:hypothetical protein